LHHPTIRTAAALLALVLAPVATHAQTNYYGYDDFGFSTSASTVSRSYSFPNATLARGNFLAALVSGVGTEDFESFAHNQAVPINLTFPGAGGATVTGTGTVARDWTVAGEWRGNDRYPTSGDMFLDVVANGGFTVTFDGPVAAFGFYAIDAGDSGGQIWLDFVNADGTTSLMVPHPVSPAGSQIDTGNILFFGRIDVDNPFTSVRFRLTGSTTDNFAFDDMTIASVEQVEVVTPEPVTLTLVGTGIAGVAAARRRRKKEVV
jgi:hypothetical protein